MKYINIGAVACLCLFLAACSSEETTPMSAPSQVELLPPPEMPTEEEVQDQEPIAQEEAPVAPASPEDALPQDTVSQDTPLNLPDLHSVQYPQLIEEQPTDELIVEPLPAPAEPYDLVTARGIRPSQTSIDALTLESLPPIDPAEDD